MKRDKDGYKEEFLQQQRNYLSELEIFKLKVCSCVYLLFLRRTRYLGCLLNIFVGTPIQRFEATHGDEQSVGGTGKQAETRFYRGRVYVLTGDDERAGSPRALPIRPSVRRVLSTSPPNQCRCFEQA